MKAHKVQRNDVRENFRIIAAAAYGLLETTKGSAECTIMAPDHHNTPDIFSKVSTRYRIAVVDCLEAAFAAKARPNTIERSLLAERCNLSTVQVAIWVRRQNQISYKSLNKQFNNRRKRGNRSRSANLGPQIIQLKHTVRDHIDTMCSSR